ncbi:MAG: cache domain-containing protein [Alphaproteobacteria bacterium]|jgi:cytochrome c|nr:hypothetical protein [Rhodospirillaceae bacterium]MBT6205894.1 hypothetical protein [Rhodospirillaceae bacterium]MBT6511113.1 hypothetical protein [Rhodospirillaceae bacterium]MBT7613334.1 hypothetical protein [Rhodospirillaceae bacterium]MDG2482946.1 cache domain-containing protein [Alphaproteobacteria bacterium]
MKFTRSIALVCALFSWAALSDAQERGTADEAQAMVADAIALYDEAGMVESWKKFNGDPEPEFSDRDRYLFIVADSGEVVVHARDPSQIGRDVTQIVDVDGKYFAQEMVDVADADGEWVDYKWGNPETGYIEFKSSWVADAIAYYEEVGRDAAFAEMNAAHPRFKERDLYIFAVTDTGDVVVQAADNNRVGKNLLDRTDANGKAYVAEMVDRATEDGVWVKYVRTDPLTGEDLPKAS